MTIAVRNGCHVCVAMHTERLVQMRVGDGLIEALRDGKPLADERLAAVQTFTLDVIATAGAVSEEQVHAFLAHGYTAQNALDVVLGVGTYTMSTLANRMVRAPLDAQLSQLAWEQPSP